MPRGKRNAIEDGENARPPIKRAKTLASKQGSRSKVGTKAKADLSRQISDTADTGGDTTCDSPGVDSSALNEIVGEVDKNSAGAQSSIKTTIKPRMSKGWDFPRFADGNIYVELVKNKKYCYWLHDKVLRRFTSFFDADEDPEEFDRVISEQIKQHMQMRAFFELQYRPDLKTWLLKQVAMTYPQVISASVKLDDQQSRRTRSSTDVISEDHCNFRSQTRDSPSLTENALGLDDIDQITTAPEELPRTNAPDDSVRTDEFQDGFDPVYQSRNSDNTPPADHGSQSIWRPSLASTTSPISRQDEALVEIKPYSQKEIDFDREDPIPGQDAFSGQHGSAKTWPMNDESVSNEHSSRVADIVENAAQEASMATSTKLPIEPSMMDSGERPKSPKIGLSSIENQQHYSSSQPLRREESKISEAIIDSFGHKPPELVLQAHHSLIALFYERDPCISKTSAHTALTQVESIITLAKHYRCLPQIRGILCSRLVILGRAIHEAIFRDPHRWLRTAVYLQDGHIFKEALIHVVGQDMDMSETKSHAMKFSRQTAELLRRKIHALKSANDTFVRKMFLSSIHIDGERRLLGDPDQECRDAGFVIMLWIEWFRDALHLCDVGATGLARLYRTIEAGDQAYLNDEEVMATYKINQNPDPSEKQQSLLRQDMAMMKAYAQTEVKPLIHHGSMVERTMIPWLTCTDIEAGEFPWRQLPCDQFAGTNVIQLD